MYVDLGVLAMMLENQPGSIRDVQVVEDDMVVHFWGSKETVTLPVQQYRDFYQKSRNRDFYKQWRLVNQPKAVSRGTAWGRILLVVGVLVVLFGYTMDTSIPSQSGGRVHNLGLISERNNHIQVGGILFVAGIILCALSDSKGK